MINYSKILRRAICIFLMSIFAFSITPAIVLHNLFADHSDTVIFHHHTNAHEVAKAGTDCHIVDFVAERNFIVPYTHININSRAGFSDFPNYFTSKYCPHFQFFKELRGPPVKV